MGEEHITSTADPGLSTATLDHLLQRFLDHATPATARAYTTDLRDLARFLDTPLPLALASLLRDPDSASRLVFAYASHLRCRPLAPTTVSRRLATLRALVSCARQLGLVSWSLQLPSSAQLEATLQPEPGSPYLFPRHPDEVDRLDLQHFALRQALGTNFLVPVSSPSRILDVGTGTGQWGFELCLQFPQALVVGFDLSGGKPNPPSGYRHVRGNLLQGLPFQDGSFDFVHQRFLTAGIPVASWPTAVAELVRVTRPEGWVELVEGPLNLRRAGPTTERLRELIFGRMASPLGLDTAGAVFRSLDEYLRRAGLEQVTRREKLLPVGEWGGQVGSFLATDLRAASMRLCEALRSRFPDLAEEATSLLHKVLEEFEQHRTLWPIAIAFGRKPG
jgi:ubiquinone/menaquinone biosynthesis C-methylase UbiE